MSAKVGIGELVVTVPEDAALVIDAHAGLGRVDVLGREDDGAGAHERVIAPGATADSPVLELDADVAIGNLEVRRGDDEPGQFPLALPRVRRAEGEGALAGVCAESPRASTSTSRSSG